MAQNQNHVNGEHVEFGEGMLHGQLRTQRTLSRSRERPCGAESVSVHGRHKTAWNSSTLSSVTEVGVMEVEMFRVEEVAPLTEAEIAAEQARVQAQNQGQYRHPSGAGSSGSCLPMNSLMRSCASTTHCMLLPYPSAAIPKSVKFQSVWQQ